MPFQFPTPGINQSLALALAVACLAIPRKAVAQAPGVPDKYTAFGAVLAPATMPAGAASAYGYAGVQEIGAGYRQGVSALELEGRAKLNYFLLAIAVEVVLKHSLARDEAGDVAPFLGVGFVYDTGSHYARSENFSYTGVRALAGLVTTYRLMDTVSAVAELDLPLDLTFSSPTGFRFNPLAGGGLEVYLGGDMTALILGQLGLEVMREPLGVTQVGLGYQIRVGVGFRLF
jgi:hypothetical protein